MKAVRNERADRRSGQDAETRKFNFDAQGEFLSDFARNYVLEGQWRRGLKVLTDVLIGMTDDQALPILKGEAELVGWATDPKGVEYRVRGPLCRAARDMASKVQEMCGEVFALNGSYWEPYATVRRLGQDDLAWARKRTRAGAEFYLVGRTLADRERMMRALFYAEKRTKDIAMVLRADAQWVMVLCRPAAEPPSWFELPQVAPEKFVQQLLAKENKWADRGCEGDFLDTAPAPVRVRVQAERVDLLKEDVYAKSRLGASALLNDFLRDLEGASDANAIAAVQRRYEGEFDEMASNAGAQLDAIEPERRAAERQAGERLVDSYRARIKAQADEFGGWLDLPLVDEDGEALGEAIQVPRNPFVLWCLSGYDFERHGRERPHWKPVVHMGMKMMGDNPMHSDWVLGAGLDLADAYRSDEKTRSGRIHASSWLLRMKIVEEWTKASFVTLARGAERRIFGKVSKPAPNEAVPAGAIAVVPTAGPEYQLAMESACRRGREGRSGALICDVGGKLAHLAVVGREQKCTVIMVPNATQRFKEGQLITLDLDTGELSWSHG